MNYKKTIATGILIASAATVVTGIHIFNDPQEFTPSTTEVDFEDTIEKSSNRVIRIVPKVKNLNCMRESSFTVNDIISEIEFEARTDGQDDEEGVESNCAKQLKNLFDKYEKETKDIENARPPKVEPVIINDADLEPIV
jgi:hypothetical protein